MDHRRLLWTCRGLTLLWIALAVAFAFRPALP